MFSQPIKCWRSLIGFPPSTLDIAYEALINSIGDATQDHLSVADALSSQIVEVLRVLEKRSDDTKKKVARFAAVVNPRIDTIAIHSTGTSIFPKDVGGQGSRICRSSQSGYMWSSTALQILRLCPIVEQTKGW